MTMIGLYKANGSWIADWSNSPRHAEIKDLFGTTHIPTAFTDKAAASAVIAEISRLNPNETVTAYGYFRV